MTVLPVAGEYHVLSPKDAYHHLSVRGHPPAMPADLRIYAVGDIHGRSDLLEQLLEATRADDAERPIDRSIYVFLGDYIDRGPSSCQVIDRLITLSSIEETVFLKGNHEVFALQSLSRPAMFERWMRLGGIDTLMSYGVGVKHRELFIHATPLQAAFYGSLPSSHLHFLKHLRTSFVCGDFLFVHAGLRPNVELAQQSEEDLLWIREEFLTSTVDFGRIVIHGHTPIEHVDIRPNRINIDTGAFATHRLTCLVLENGYAAVIDTAT